MQKTILWLTVFYIFIISLVVFSTLLSAQNPPAPMEIEFQPLINFDDFFVPLKQWFTDQLKEYWVMLLSIFFVWFTLMCALSYLDGYLRRRASIRRYRTQIRDRQAAWELEREGNQEHSRRERIERMAGRMGERAEARRLFYEREATRRRQEEVRKAFDNFDEELRKAYQEHEREIGVYKTSDITPQWSDATIEKFRSTDYANDYADISRWDNMRTDGSWDTQTDDAYFEAAYKRDSIFESYRELGRDFGDFYKDHEEYMSLYSDKFDRAQLQTWLDVGDDLYRLRGSLDERYDAIGREYESLGEGELHRSMEMQRAWREGYSSHDRGGY